MAERLTILVEARDAATAVMRRVGRGLSTLTRPLRALVRGFTNLRNLIAIGIGSVAVRAFDNLIKKGGEAVTIQTAFTRVVGDTDQAMTKLRRATQGLVSDLDLITQFNRAMALGSAASVEQFAELARTALTLGRALGVDAAFALESLSLGIGRQSRLILDNLGLIVSVGSANRKYAAALGITTKELTDAQKAEAFRTAALDAARAKIAELGGTTLNAADRITQLKVTLSNTVVEIAKTIAQSDAVAEAFGDIADQAESLSAFVLENQELLGQWTAQTIEATSAALDFVGALGQIALGLKEFIAPTDLAAIERAGVLADLRRRVAATEAGAAPSEGGVTIGGIAIQQEFARRQMAAIRDFAERSGASASAIEDALRPWREFLDETARLAERLVAARQAAQAGPAAGPPRLSPMGFFPSGTVATGLPGLRLPALGPGAMRELPLLAALEAAARAMRDLEKAANDTEDAAAEAARQGEETARLWGAAMQEIVIATAEGANAIAGAFRGLIAIIARKVEEEINRVLAPKGFLAGIGVGLLGGLAGGAITLLGRALTGGGTEREVPVRARFTPEGERQLRDAQRPEGPDTVILKIQGASGRETEYVLRRREERDAIERIPSGVSF